MQSRSKQSRWSPRAVGLVLVLLALAAGPAAAQVPQNMTFSGRLVDGGGTPLAGPVQLDLYIMAHATLNVPLYGERHLVVPLDAQGNFSVLLGAGDDPFFGSFAAATFADVERYVEVNIVDGGIEVLTPRVPLASVPWALVAQQANAIVPDPSAPRFEDCGDGTVADHQTGLQWEKKTGPPELGYIPCDTTPCLDPHDQRNHYRWSLPGSTEPDGGVFTDFLARLNGVFDPVAATGCFAGHCDWRLSQVSELQTILIGEGGAPGQNPTCAGPPSEIPCIDPDFTNVGGVADAGGPTAPLDYISANPIAGTPANAWVASFDPGAQGSGNVIDYQPKDSENPVRAVRTGSCQ